MGRTGTGKRILRAAAALTAVSGFLADWNETHIFNPNWPPHAKFHDVQTVLVALLLGTSGLYFLRQKEGDEALQLKVGALLPALLWISQGGSFLFPGAGGMDTEFPHTTPKIGGVYINERVSSSLMLLLIGVGYALERRDTRERRRR